MSTKAGTIEAGHGAGFGLREWLMAAIAAVAVAALVMSFLALRQGSPTVSLGRQAAGTAVYERSQPVTGTGPALVWFANAQGTSGIYGRSQPVTGTGPDLVAVADRSISEDIYRRSGPVTGTGPGLEHVGRP
jgi:hypothetical protein